MRPEPRQHRRHAEHDAAAGDRDHQPAAVEQQHQAGATEHRAELPGRVEEADVAIGESSTLQREADDDHLGEPLEEEQRRGRRPGQPQGRMGGEGAEAGGDLARRLGGLGRAVEVGGAGVARHPEEEARRRSATATAQTPKRKAGEVAVSRKPAPIAPRRLPEFSITESLTLPAESCWGVCASIGDIEDSAGA